MDCLILLAHPKGESLNHALAQAVRQRLLDRGHCVYFHDLYQEGFDPLLTAQELSEDFEPQGLLKVHCHQLVRSDLVVVVHPNYRNQAPAMLKGWVDRVIRSGVAFRYEGEAGERGEQVGLLGGKSALVINTADCPEESDRKYGFPIRKFWEKFVFGNSGIENCYYRSFYNVLFSSLQERESWITECGELADQALNSVS